MIDQYIPEVSIADRLQAFIVTFTSFPLRAIRSGIAGGFRESLIEYRISCGIGVITVLQHHSSSSEHHSTSLRLLKLEGYEGVLIHACAHWYPSASRPLERVFWLGSQPPFTPDEEGVACWLRLPGLPMPIGHLRHFLLRSLLPGYLQVDLLNQVESLLDSCSFDVGPATQQGCLS